MKDLLKYKDYDEYKYRDYMTASQIEYPYASLTTKDGKVYYSDQTTDNFINESFSVRVLSGNLQKIRLKHNWNHLPNTSPQYMCAGTKISTCNSKTGEIDYSEDYEQYETTGIETEVVDGVTYKKYSYIDIPCNLMADKQIWLFSAGEYLFDSYTEEHDTTIQHGCIEFEFYGTSDLLVSVQGNIMSMLCEDNSTMYSDDYTGDETGATAPYMLYKCFFGQTAIKYAHLLALPVKTLPANAYRSMFHNCTNLKTAPKLPATVLAEYCYMSMFYGCTSLEDVRNISINIVSGGIPANSMRSMFNSSGLRKPMDKIEGNLNGGSTSSYNTAWMFYSCYNLEYAPKLTFGNIARYGTTYMFGFCTNMKTFDTFNITGTPYQYACFAMCSDCKKLTYAFPEFKAGSFSSQHHFNRFFNNCSSLERAPRISITTLSQYQFMYAFRNCSKLSYVDATQVTGNTATSCTSSWMAGAKNTSDCEFYRNENLTWARSTSGVPANWTIIPAQT